MSKVLNSTNVLSAGSLEMSELESRLETMILGGVASVGTSPCDDASHCDDFCHNYGSSITQDCPTQCILSQLCDNVSPCDDISSCDDFCHTDGAYAGGDCPKVIDCEGDI